MVVLLQSSRACFVCLVGLGFFCFSILGGGWVFRALGFFVGFFLFFKNVSKTLTKPFNLYYNNLPYKFKEYFFHQLVCINKKKSKTVRRTYHFQYYGICQGKVEFQLDIANQPLFPEDVTKVTREWY